MNKDLTNQLYSRAAAYCSTAERCRTEVVEKLKAWDKEGEADASQIIERLEQEGFLDEQRYAQAFANDKMRFQGWGKLKIRAALAQKRLSSRAIHEALDGLDEEIYRQTLLKLAEKKRRELRKEPDKQVLRQKLSRFLAGRGFSLDEIQSVVR